MFQLSDFADAASVMGLVQRGQANKQLGGVLNQLQASQRQLQAHQQLENAKEKAKKFAVDAIIYIENFANWLEKLRSESLAGRGENWSAVFDHVLANSHLSHLLKKGGKEFPVEPLTSYAILLTDQKLHDNIRKLCGSSLDLRRNFEQQITRICAFHDSVPSEQLVVYRDVVAAVRKGLVKEKLSTKFAQVLKFSLGSGEISASAEWVNLMNDLERKLGEAGLTLQALSNATIRLGHGTINSISPHCVVNSFAGCLIDYDKLKRKFVIDSNVCRQCTFKFEVGKQLHTINELGDVERVKRCYVEKWRDGKPRNWANYLLGWKGEELLSYRQIASGT